MYGFRKALSAGTFDGLHAFGVSLKSALVVAQVLGYMTAKFLGIKYISELKPGKRPVYILGLIGGAHLCLLFMALIPIPFNVLFLFGNGLCLGLIWGLVFSYVEGRRFTDFLALVLSINFIFSSGVAKSLGRICLDLWHIEERFMPFLAGCFYIPLLLLAVWMLTRIPPPTPEESRSRGVRVALSAAERKKLLMQFLPGLFAVTLLNLLLTILRDLKDNYGVEILRKLKPAFNPSIFTTMETIAAFSVFGMLLLLTLFKDHFRSIVSHHLAILSGLALMMGAAWTLHQGSQDPVLTLILYTTGLYVCYNTLQCLFLDRFISAFHIRGNIGFFFYFMDSIGYLGSCVIIIYKEIFSPRVDWLPYFISVSIILGIIGIASVLFSLAYFRKKYKTQRINLQT
jgi:hypothetical protein